MDKDLWTLYSVTQEYGSLHLELTGSETRNKAEFDLKMRLPEQPMELDQIVHESVQAMSQVDSVNREDIANLDFSDVDEKKLSMPYHSSYTLVRNTKTSIEVTSDRLHGDETVIRMYSNEDFRDLDSAILSTLEAYEIVANAIFENGVDIKFDFNITETNKYVQSLRASYLRRFGKVDSIEDVSEPIYGNSKTACHAQHGQVGSPQVITDNKFRPAFPDTGVPNSLLVEYSRSQIGFNYARLLREDPVLNKLSSKGETMIARTIDKLSKEAYQFFIRAEFRLQKELFSLAAQDYRRAIRIRSLALAAAERLGNDSHTNYHLVLDIAKTEHNRAAAVAAYAACNGDFARAERECRRTLINITELLDDLLEDIDEQVAPLKRNFDSEFYSISELTENTYFFELEGIRNASNRQKRNSTAHLRKLIDQSQTIAEDERINTSRFNPLEMHPEERIKYFIRMERYEEAALLRDFIKMRDKIDPLELEAVWWSPNTQRS